MRVFPIINPQGNLLKNLCVFASLCALCVEKSLLCFRLSQSRVSAEPRTDFAAYAAFAAKNPLR